MLRVLGEGIHRLRDPWMRRALRLSWHKWRYFEFWPAWLFYLPVVPMYLYLALRNRSVFAPFFANPGILNSGLIGESKWDFLQWLDPKDPSTLQAVKVLGEDTQEAIKQRIQEAGLGFPLIAKPDVGQRGFGVRVIRSLVDLAEYRTQAKFDLILQKQSPLQREAGLFFIRPPGTKDGFIFSITDKHLPVVIGDGRTRLGDLILADRRARMIAKIYFARFGSARLNTVPAISEVVRLTECGNHCQGAVFFNGQQYLSATLTARLNALAGRIPDFHFGRFDVRFVDLESLREGHFEIIEINGAGSEATHIWDRQTTLLEAYQTLFAQWSWLFQIGTSVKRSKHKTHFEFWHLVREVLRVTFRASPLGLSS